jgi:hypothetical protein
MAKLKGVSTRVRRAICFTSDLPYAHNAKLEAMVCWYVLLGDKEYTLKYVK